MSYTYIYKLKKSTIEKALWTFKTETIKFHFEEKDREFLIISDNNEEKKLLGTTLNTDKQKSFYKQTIEVNAELLNDIITSIDSDVIELVYNTEHPKVLNINNDIKLTVR